MSLVDPGRREAPVPTRRTTRGTVIVSLALHVGVLAAVIVVPLFGDVTLPRTTDDRPIATFVRAEAAPSVPPPPAAATPIRSSSPREALASAPTPVTAPVPLEAPAALPMGDPPAYVPGARLHGSLPASALGSGHGGVPGASAVPAPPPPTATSHAPIRVGGDIQPPRKLRHVAPAYPNIAVQARVTGTVILEATIAPSGEVIDVRVLRSVPLLDAAAVDAVRQWRYEPTRLNGTAVAVLLTVTVRFGQ